MGFLKLLFGFGEYEMPDDWIPKGYVANADGCLFRPEFLALTQEEKAKICNGVGAAEGLSKLLPDTVFGMSIADIADQHDYDYWLGGTTADRLNADIVFFNSMLRRFKNMGSAFLYPFRRHRAKVYFKFLREFGFKHFNVKVIK